MNPWQTRAELLRWWRSDVARRSQRDLATSLGVARTAVSNWERGTRLASIDADRLDAALAGDGALRGLLWAVGTPWGLPPVRVWTNVYRGPSSPVWMWIRSDAPRVAVEAEWGLYGLEVDGELPPNGRFITLGASIDESPLKVVLSEPGWVDFGRGSLPEDIPGAEVHDALDIMKQSSAAGDPFNDLLSANLAATVERPPPGPQAPDQEPFGSLTSFLDGLAAGGRQAPGRRSPLPAGRESQERSAFARLREARKLSLGETVARLQAETGISVGKDTLRRFEVGTGRPNRPLLPVALDHVLGGNGHLALETIRSGTGPGTVVFPDYWNAPIWLELDGPRAPVPDGLVAELQWGGWRRALTGDLPLAVICHGAPRVLRIDTAPTVRWSVGVGRRQGATPIDQGWLPTSVDATQEAISAYREALMDAVRATADRRNRRNEP